MNIKVSDKLLGEINIKTVHDIDKVREYTMKSLCMLQILCMNPDSDKNTFNEFLEIMRDAVKKSEDLFNGKTNESEILNQF